MCLVQTETLPPANRYTLHSAMRPHSTPAALPVSISQLHLSAVSGLNAVASTYRYQKGVPKHPLPQPSYRCNLSPKTSGIVCCISF